jgi:hypothetical protein
MRRREARTATAFFRRRAWQDERMRPSSRLLRYGTPIAMVIVGALFAAVDTNSVGNTVSLVMIAGGLIWFMTALGREMGMTANTGRAPRVPDLPPDEDERADDRDR